MGLFKAWNMFGNMLEKEYWAAVAAAGWVRGARPECSSKPDSSSHLAQNLGRELKTSLNAELRTDSHFCQLQKELFRLENLGCIMYMSEVDFGIWNHGCVLPASAGGGYLYLSTLWARASLNCSSLAERCCWLRPSPSDCNVARVNST